MKTRLLQILSISAVAVLLTACGGSETPPSPDKATNAAPAAPEAPKK